MLIIVHDGNAEFFAQLSFDPETLRSFDVFQVDGAEGWLKRFDDGYESVGIFFVDFNVEHVNARKPFEKNALAFHYRLGSLGSDIAQSQDSCTVRDDRYEISLCGVLVNIFLIRGNFPARFGYPR